jgi:hypothetical protein
MVAKSAAASFKLGPVAVLDSVDFVVWSCMQVMNPSSGSWCPMEGAHLPDHPSAAMIRISEGVVGHLGELPRPRVEVRLTCPPGHLVQRVHPLGQVVEVLAVPVPLQLLVKGLGDASLGERLADSQTASSRVSLAFLFTEPADPSGSRIIGTIDSKHVMHLVDQPEREIRVALFARRLRQSEEVADREGVSP